MAIGVKQPTDDRVGTVGEGGHGETLVRGGGVHFDGGGFEAGGRETVLAMRPGEGVKKGRGEGANF